MEPNDGVQAKVRDSTLGRLLQELSWAGSTIRDFRQGGLGFENVLTAEALTALDFLPRNAFLGAILLAAQGAERARLAVAAEVEDAQITLLPDEVLLRASANAYQEQMVVQPDGILTSPSCYVLIEAKRIRKSSFQPEQLAREYVAVMREANGRTPLLLLLLGTEPPVAVKGAGRLSIEQAIALHLGSVLARAERHAFEESDLIARIPESVAWITWPQLGEVVEQQRATFVSPNPSVTGSVARMAESVLDAIARHS